MRFNAYITPSLALYRMRAWLSLIVMPRSRSRSIPSRYCACIIQQQCVSRLHRLSSATPLLLMFAGVPRYQLIPEPTFMSLLTTVSVLIRS